MKIRSLILVLAVTLTGATALTKEVMVTDRFEKELPIDLGGSVIIDNPVGNIEIIGTDEEKISWVAVKTIRGIDRDAIEEARMQVQLTMAGDQRVRILRTLIPPFRSGRWAVSVKYAVRVPRTVHVKVISHSSDRIRITDIRGNVNVTNFAGMVLLDRVSGVSFVDSSNGDILLNAPSRIMSNAQLNTVNGNIEVRAPAEASFQWVGETVKGDARTTFPVRIRAFGNNSFRGSINAPGGPIIATSTLMGNIFVLKNGSQSASAKSVKIREPDIPTPKRTPYTAAAQTIQQTVVEGPFFNFVTSLGNIAIGEIRGAAKVVTGAGEVQLGSVYGNCEVISFGGPLNLGEILGSLNARTVAGDILVQAAREGGTITTGGGIIRLLYTGGPVRLQSGGGDIVVRQAAAPVSAETRSGDITITLDPAENSQKISARTSKGNVILNVTPTFAAEIDATVMTSDPDTNRFKSDFAGLSIQRDQVSGKTRIRATGKINGGGDKIELFAEDGGIQINSSRSAPISVIAPH